MGATRANGPGWHFVAIPAATLLAVSPFALAVPFDPDMPGHVLPHFTMLPFWAGLACGPGYIWGWLALRRGWQLGRFAMALVYVSVAASVVCSAAGALFGLFTVVFGIGGIASAVLAAALLIRLIRQRS